MKTLYITRHAKSSWKHPELTDFERPLNKRGRRDAPFMGRVLNELGIRPDLILSSPANRAITLARVLAKEIDYPLEDLRSDERIYLGTTDDLLQVIRATEDSVAHLMLVGHNPGLTMLSNSLSDTHLDNIPTSGIAVVEFPVDTWQAIRAQSGTLRQFEFPKKYA